ncbi:MAG TPA: sensor histidine kinase, partial [Anaeromyxobacteraceae bacterium]|nr:sensor histidine kinase [Anaeromyxobacteraceae bacterium]
MPEETGRQPTTEPARAPPSEGHLAEALEGILAVEPGGRSPRRLVAALVASVPAADSAALLSTDGDRFELAAAVGLDGDEAPDPGPLVREAFAAGGPVTAADPGPPFPPGTRAGAAAPLAGERGPLGVLLLGSRTADRL